MKVGVPNRILKERKNITEKVGEIQIRSVV